MDKVYVVEIRLFLPDEEWGNTIHVFLSEAEARDFAQSRGEGAMSSSEYWDYGLEAEVSTIGFGVGGKQKVLDSYVFYFQHERCSECNQPTSFGHCDCEHEELDDF